MARTKGRKRKWSVVHPRAAGIDIGSRFHVVAVSEDLDAKPVRTFSTFTNDLHRLAEWLKGLGIATVAMESTGVYWIPAFEILQPAAQDVAEGQDHVPGRQRVLPLGDAFVVRAPWRRLHRGDRAQQAAERTGAAAIDRSAPPAGMGLSRGSLTNQGTGSLTLVNQLTHKVSDTHH